MNNACACGARITAITYDTSRAITHIPSNHTEAPLEETCASGHTSTRWVTYDQAREIIQIHQREIVA